MQHYYGEQNILRALDEAEFWKHQEEEHTEVIQLVAPKLEQEYKDELKQFGHDFNAMHGQTIQYVESIIRSGGKLNRPMENKILRLLEDSIRQSRGFISLLQEILMESKEIENNIPAQTVIKHVIRESEYFIGIDQLILQ